MISLSQADGADRFKLAVCTHPGKKKSGAAIDLYTTYPWDALCVEIAKFKVLWWDGKRDTRK